MLDSTMESVLKRLLAATKEGRLRWQQDADGYFTAPIGTHNETVLIRRMFLEAANQVGADPYFVELSMHGLNTRFPIAGDSDGWRYISKILDAAFPQGWSNGADKALAFLDLQLPEQPPDKGLA